MDSIKLLEKLNACQAGIDFVSKYDSFEAAWNACERGDWMLWLAAKLNVPTKTLTLAKGLCVNTVRSLMKDERSIAAVDAAIAFGHGKISAEKLKAAADTAAAVYAAANAAADAAVYAAANAAYAAAADADAYAAYAAYAAADADAYAAYVAADAANAANAATKNRKETAEICRRVLTRSVMARVK
jgi:hypothetical protein